VIGFAAAAAIAILFAIAWPGEKEPEYKGKKLSEWLEIYGKSNISVEQREQAPVALKHIGTNAVPFLLKWINCDARPRYRARLAGKLPAWAQKTSVGQKWLRSDVDAFLAGNNAVAGFQVLGEEAASAIPALTRIMRGPRSGPSERWAAESLAFLGKDALPPMLEILSDRQQPNTKRVYVAAVVQHHMGYLGSNAIAVVPVLIECCLSDTNEFIWMTAGATLIGFASERDLDIGFAVGKMASPDPALRRVAIRSLGQHKVARGVKWNDGTGVYYGATTVISNALTDSDALVRAEATNALRKVAPEMLEGK